MFFPFFIYRLYNIFLYVLPSRLFWPKSKCYDFLYQEAEELLKNFPVQATISLYEESDSSSEDEEFADN